MNTENDEGMHTAGRAEREVGPLVSEGTDTSRLAAKCCYCHKPARGWSIADAAMGKRWQGGALEYHCYSGYCWD
jgi:hypothetical protein